MIKLSEVSKIYSAKSGNVTAVDNVSLEVEKGEIYGIIGYSGAGKSSLIRLLNGLEKPSSGTIEVAGKKLNTIKEADLRKARQKISMIFQHFNLLWSRTVSENISFPLEIAGIPKKKRDQRVKELIELTGLNGREKAYPSQLSGGQKQRVGIARALANNPEVLLCDEATSALDPQTTDSILDLLTDINQKLGLTIVLITHEMHVIRKICHRVAVMESGKVVEEGKVLNIFQHPKQPITKRFVQQITEPEDTKETISELIRQYKTGKVVQLTFVGDSTGQPVITELIRQHQVEVNILHGKITQTQSGAYGTLFLHLEGEEAELAKALNFLKQHEVDAEVMTNV
ncbi:methionine ABC transporter ATP-binding protein [Metabacillus sp. GX 13764]|uniref:methionine ABC transporter ATP-binding protein n=1 Tax=Metabacillus kandeliae TaxID=2900151 RepID=UPI001E2A81A5|nr:methionine ABC transporter ATP-binding protein [Metabacillus kandeliae]MCD7036286.1 methionine ABC transporter ATP-binding protein [Metabacillus kandeliae]